MPSHNKGSKGGFPIRKSLDQRLFAAPQGLSQRTTSFIASQRQGIHQMLFTHLIALMIHGRLKSKRHGRAARSLGRERTARKTWLPSLEAVCLPNRPGPRPAGPRWWPERTGPRIYSLFTMSNTREPPKEAANLVTVFPDDTGQARVSGSATKGRSTNASLDIPQDPLGIPGGARRDRTDDLMLAKHALSQLSYGPLLRMASGGSTG